VKPGNCHPHAHDRVNGRRQTRAIGTFATPKGSAFLRADHVECDVYGGWRWQKYKVIGEIHQIQGMVISFHGISLLWTSPVGQFLLCTFIFYITHGTNGYVQEANEIFAI
jgi:hypothetical protein